jgi:hypothetical protein
MCRPNTGTKIVCFQDLAIFQRGYWWDEKDKFWENGCNPLDLLASVPDGLLELWIHPEAGLLGVLQ